MKHSTHEDLLNHRVNIELIGVGGTGCQVLSGLVRLHLAILDIGHPYGLKVTAWDPGIIRQANIGRQLFYPGEVGTNKAVALINKYNIAFGLDWEAHPGRFAPHVGGTGDIVICCVDTREARRQIRDALKLGGNFNYVIDCGNGDSYGQVLIGSRWYKELPLPWEALPALIAKGKEDNTPSCSLAEALNSQELFINQEIATEALKLLWSLFRHGGLDRRGVYINQLTGVTRPVKI